MLLVKLGRGYEDIKPLPCDRWSCEHCGPRRRRRLIAQAASGQPNKILTITVNPAVGLSPLDRRDKLHDAWKRLAKRILRQFAIAPERRWHLKSKERPARREAIIRSITARTARLEVTKLHYMAFLEKTKLGEPHLHILLRCPYLPQDWISEQMADLMGAPICWIEQVANTRQAVRYVTKYVTKEPAQFGNRKRYWLSRGWEIGERKKRPDGGYDYTGVRVRRERWEDVQWRITSKGLHVDPLIDGWRRVYDSRNEWSKAQDRYANRLLSAQ